MKTNMSLNIDLSFWIALRCSEVKPYTDSLTIENGKTTNKLILIKTERYSISLTITNGKTTNKLILVKTESCDNFF